jgi:hypothetical protein
MRRAGKEGTTERKRPLLEGLRAFGERPALQDPSVTVVSPLGEQKGEDSLQNSLPVLQRAKAMRHSEAT